MNAIEEFRQRHDTNMKELESVLALIKAELGVEPIRIACAYSRFDVLFMLPTSKGECRVALEIAPEAGTYWMHFGPMCVRELVPTLRAIMAE